jgi:D-sedoheptulose 7-phosphate isomerase
MDIKTRPESRVDRYFATLSNVLSATAATDSAGRSIVVPAAVDWVIDRLERVGRSYKIIFIGNGGSAGISSHLAIDYLKNGGIPALAFNDGASITCLANDLGYENVFAKQIDMHGRNGDLLIAISSSGRSPNILNGVASARQRGMDVVTLSGFTPDNPLRAAGDVNFYVDNDVYGFVEISHLALCHAFLDMKMGWR